MKDNLIQIPQRLWEDYVQYRDRMEFLLSAPPNDMAANQEWGILNEHVRDIESIYDCETLRLRYDESLTKEQGII